MNIKDMRKSERFETVSGQTRLETYFNLILTVWHQLRTIT